MKDLFKIPTGTRESRIKANVMKRQNLKKKWDKKCKYEAESNIAEQGACFAIENFAEGADNFVRLLDEGVVVDGSGYAYAVIAKGTLKAWYDNLPSNYKGTINKDHISAIDLGSFTKSDLKLVELENGRYGIDVNVKLDKELYAVKDLLRMMNRKALSSEFYYDAEKYITAEAATGDEKQGKWLIPIIDQIAIEGYAVVDNPKNANSYDDGLLEKASASEGEEMDKDELKKAELEAADAEADAATDGAEVTDEGSTQAPDTSTGGGEADTTDEGADADAKTEDASAGEGADEGADEGEADEGEGEGDKEEASDKKEEVTLEKLAAAIESLKADIKAKDAKIAELEAQVADKQAKSDKYKEDLEKLFNFATTDEPGSDEGKATSDEQGDKSEDAFAAALAAEFAKMEG